MNITTENYQIHITHVYISIYLINLNDSGLKTKKIGTYFCIRFRTLRIFCDQILNLATFEWSTGAQNALSRSFYIHSFMIFIYIYYISRGSFSSKDIQTPPPSEVAILI